MTEKQKRQQDTSKQWATDPRGQEALDFLQKAGDLYDNVFAAMAGGALQHHLSATKIA